MNCPRCGQENPPHAKFCLECAAPLRGAREALEGERKRVTVLFADLESSLELVAGRDPEEARRLFDGVLERMMDAVRRYEGTVNQIMGDGIMALFGAPLAHEDHAVRACCAALRMQESMREFAAEQSARFGDIRVRIGVNSGEVLVRSIAGDLHMDYSAVGQTTHLAARMEKLAEPGTTLATAEVVRLVEGHVITRPRGRRAIKGLSQPVEVYEVVGTAPMRTRVQLAARRGLTRFVGRDAELALLEQAFELARAGQGQVAALVGQPGVGKSRLLFEFMRGLRQRGVPVFESTAMSRGEAIPYFSAAALLARLLDLHGSEEGEALRGKIEQRLEALDPRLREHLSALLAMFDAPGADAQWALLEPPQRHQRTLEAAKALLLAHARAAPLVITVEDLHWIDGESQDVLDHLVQALPGARVLMLVEHRPEYANDWAGASCYRALRIEPLPQASAAGLLDSLLGADPALGGLKRRLLARTEGNALFLEESVRALADSAALSGKAGEYHLARPLEAIEIPAMVQDVLAARLDLLPPREKALVQVAAVLGKDLSAAVLRRVAHLADAELADALARLQGAEFLAETSRFPDLQYSFKHAFTHEVVYASLPIDRRKRLHGETVDAIEEVYGARAADKVEVLAHHTVQAEQWQRAVGYLRRAAARAYERSAYRTAAAYSDQAIRAVAHLPLGSESTALAIDLRLEQRNPLLALGALERMLSALRQTEPLAESLGDDARRARVAAQLAGYYWLIGQHREAAEAGERALALARDERTVAIPTRFYLAAARHSMGEHNVAVALLETNAARLAGEATHERFGMAGLPSVFTRAWLAWARTDLGDFAAARESAQDAMRIALASRHPFSIATARFAQAVVALSAGELQEAIQVLETALLTARSERLALWVPPFAAQLGLALARSARASDAVLLLERTLLGPSEAIAFTPFAAAVLGEAYLAAGRVENASVQAERALQRARRRHERGYEGWALKLLGDVAATRELSAAQLAEEHYRAAIARGQELGMRPLAAQAWLGLAAVHARSHRRAEASAAYDAALGLLEEMGLEMLLDKARAAASAALRA